MSDVLASSNNCVVLTATTALRLGDDDSVVVNACTFSDDSEASTKYAAAIDRSNILDLDGSCKEVDALLSLLLLFEVLLIIAVLDDVVRRS